MGVSRWKVAALAIFCHYGITDMLLLTSGCVDSWIWLKNLFI